MSEQLVSRLQSVSLTAPTHSAATVTASSASAATAASATAAASSASADEICANRWQLPLPAVYHLASGWIKRCLEGGGVGGCTTQSTNDPKTKSTAAAAAAAASVAQQLPVVALGYEQRVQLAALAQQVAHGPCLSAPRPAVGALDLVGRARRDAWLALGYASREQCQLQYVQLVATLLNGGGGISGGGGDGGGGGGGGVFDEYVARVRQQLVLLEQQEQQQQQQLQQHQQQQLLEQQQRATAQQIQDALNRQTYGQFREYAERQYPGQPEHQALLVRQLQQQHYCQYMQQLYHQQQQLQQQQQQQLQQQQNSSPLSAAAGGGGVRQGAVGGDVVDGGSAAGGGGGATSQQQQQQMQPAPSVQHPANSSGSLNSTALALSTNTATATTFLPAPATTTSSSSSTSATTADNTCQANIDRQCALTTTRHEQPTHCTAATATHAPLAVELCSLQPAQLWTRENIAEFKSAVRAEDAATAAATGPSQAGSSGGGGGGGRSVLCVAHGETVSVHVPLVAGGRQLHWEFATDHYDLGFGLWFEWRAGPPVDHVTVTYDSSDSDTDDYDDDGEEEEPHVCHDVGQNGHNGGDHHHYDLTGETPATATGHSAHHRRRRRRSLTDSPPATCIIPVYRRDCHRSVYIGSHAYPTPAAAPTPAPDDPDLTTGHRVGVYVLKFDNSYSLWRSKTLYYRVYYSR